MIGSIGSGAVSTTADVQRRAESEASSAAKTVADHVAVAGDKQEPIRSALATQGTLVDTYL